MSTLTNTEGLLDQIDERIGDDHDWACYEEDQYENYKDQEIKELINK